MGPPLRSATPASWDAKKKEAVDLVTSRFFRQGGVSKKAAEGDLSPLMMAAGGGLAGAFLPSILSSAKNLASSASSAASQYELPAGMSVGGAALGAGAGLLLSSMANARRQREEAARRRADVDQMRAMQRQYATQQGLVGHFG